MGQTAGVELGARLGKMPEKVLQLILTVLVPQQLDEGPDTELGVAGQLTSGGTDLVWVGIEDIRGKQGAEVGDGLLGGWHITLREGTEHLIGVQLLMNPTLEDGLIFVAGEEWFGITSPRGLAATKTGRHGCCRAGQSKGDQSIDFAARRESA